MSFVRFVFVTLAIGCIRVLKVSVQKFDEGVEMLVGIRGW